ncbi:MAG: haloacid dehalogenase type II [Betaproteobacteria bacterium HGW-Betaproteobacteria-5]|jgi:2-haloacid dehalogenase|nr:MAG: haloacid dehalogenase type II [Betaproteobacteria bacterium HGW-Betaproteobacteria-5]PKO39156.1 MAG: haloacid dehalogenase type II [Betaproteobacteria bacterium HGW-Betaproteobacteria-6]
MTATKLTGIEVCVFDAYGTLFDVSSVAGGARDALKERWQALSDLWRNKQLQYTWLRGLAGNHANFWEVTSDALNFAMASLEIDDAELKERLMSLYLSINPYPEVPAMLARLKHGGLKLAILSNGTPQMLGAAVDNSGIRGSLDAILSVESVGVFKPHPSVYEMACSHFGLSAEKICFISSNGWDAFSAKAFGFRVLWCNRFHQVPEQIPETPDGEISDLTQLPTILGVN